MRTLLMAVSLACYAAFFASFAYLVGFVGGFDFLPGHVDKGPTAPPAIAALIDTGLIALFGLQHSVMARQGFKRGWTRIVPAPLERSFYCLASALALLAMFVFWHPIPGNIWSVDSEAGRTMLWVLFWAGWGVLFIATWLINHFELFGLAQAWHHLRGSEAPQPKFRTPLFYRWVRHPIYTGFLLAFWAAPVMSPGHLLLAAGMTVYIFIGIAYEERDLIAQFGEEYRAYLKAVGGVIPGLGKRG